MAVYFLADIHLSEQQPDITAAFKQCITTLTNESTHQLVEGIFILGDLFDYYLGDDLMSPFQQNIAAFLKPISQHIPIFFQHGNRDFLINQRFMCASGLTLLPERFIFTLDDDVILLEHGDLLCSDDVGYQRMRRLLRHSLTQTIYRIIPSNMKHGIARFLRKQSGRAGKVKAAEIVDTNLETIDHTMQEFGANTLIHGHTHRPNIQSVAHGRCYVVGDWRPEGKIIVYQNKQFHLLKCNELA